MANTIDKVLLWLAFSLVAVSLPAQTSYYRHFTTTDGLPHNTAFHVNQDRDGVIWICTDNGMARFDGDRFRWYDKSNGFTSNYPIMAANVSDGRQVVAMWKGFPVVFDGDTAIEVPKSSDGYREYFHNLVLASDSLLVLNKFENSIIMMAANRPPYRFTTKVLIPRGEQYCLTQNMTIHSPFFRKKAPRLYAARDTLFVFGFTRGMWIAHRDSCLSPAWEGILGDQTITALHRSEDGSYWAAVPDRFFHIKGNRLLETVEIPNSKTVKRIKSYRSSILIYSTYDDANRASGALYYFDTEKNQRIRLDQSLGLNAASTEFMVDREGNLWVPTHGNGVYLVPLKLLDGGNNTPVPRPNMIHQSRDGKIWVSGYKGLSYFLPPGYQKKHDILDEETKIIGSLGTDLYYLNMVDGITKSLPSKSLDAGFTKLMLPYAKGFCVHDHTSVSIVDTYFRPLGKEQRIWPMKILAWYHLGEHTILGGTDKGLRLLSIDSLNNIDLTPPGEPTLAPLKEQVIHAICASRDGGLWLGGETGIWKYFPDSALEHIGTHDNMPFLYPGSLAEDSAGILWIGTKQGLMRYDGHQFRGIEHRTGLLGNDVNALLVDDRNYLWVTTSKGLNIFSPAQQKSLFEAVPSPFLVRNPNFQEKESLPQGSDLSLRLQALNYLTPDQTLTQYKVDDGPWTYFGPDELSIPKPRAGNHMLRLRGRMANSDWFELNPLPFRITPWWQNPIWLSIIAGLVILGLLGILYARRRLRKERQYSSRLQTLIAQREEAESALGKIRQEIAKDYHDELGNYLASITVLSSMARKHYQDNHPGTPEVLARIASNSKQLHAVTKDFLWTIEGKWHYLDELIVYLADKGSDFFEPLDISFEVTNPHSHNETRVKLSLTVGRNVLLIFKEAMTNVGKYAKASEVKLELEVFEEGWAISLKNNGPNIPLPEEPLGRGLGNMRTRARKIGCELLLLSNLTRLTYKEPSDD